MKLISDKDQIIDLFKENCILETKNYISNRKINFENLLIFENISNLIKNFLNNLNNFELEIENKWRKDFNLLQKKYNLDENDTYFLNRKGDFHDKGRAVSIISDKSKIGKVVYKPRNTESLEIFYSLIEKIDKNFIKPKIICKENYAWVEYISTENHELINEIQLRNLGIIMGLAYCTNTSDLISENFIITNWGPIPIDIEVFCRPQLKNIDGELEKQASVLSTNILPIPGFEESELCLADKMLMKYAKQKEEGVKAILDGFRCSYQWCAENLKRYMPFNFTGRILLRFTKTYSSYLNYMSVPSTKDINLECTSKLLRYGKNFSDPQLVAQCEIEQLSQYDIPSFYYNYNDLFIYNDAYKHVLTIIQKTSKECLEEKLYQLSDHDLNIQCALIKSTLGSELIKKSRYSDFLKNNTLHINDRKYLLLNDGENISYMGDSFYFGTKVFLDRDFIPSKLNIESEQTVFSKFDEIIYKYLDQGDDYYNKMVEVIYNDIRKNGFPEYDNYYSGTAGVLSLLCSNEKIINNLVAKKLAGNLFDLLLSKIDDYGGKFNNIFGFPQTGFAYGASGIAFSMYLYAKIFKLDKIVEIYKLIEWEDTHYDNRTGTWRDLRNTKYSGGNNYAFCNGAVGALISRSILFNEKQFLEKNYNMFPLIEAIKNEKNLGWCHGLSSTFELALNLKTIDIHSYKEILDIITLNRIEYRPIIEDLTLMNGWGGVYYLNSKINKFRYFRSPLTFKEYYL